MNEFRLHLLPYYMHELKKELESYMAKKMAALGITESDSKYLHALHLFDNKATLKDLTAFTHYDKAFTSRIINSLEKNGFIVRDDSVKKRNFEIRLTEKGIRTAKEIHSYINDWENAVMDSLQDNDKEALQKIFTTIIEEAKAINSKTE